MDCASLQVRSSRAACFASLSNRRFPRASDPKRREAHWEHKRHAKNSSKDSHCVHQPKSGNVSTDDSSTYLEGKTFFHLETLSASAECALHARPTGHGGCCPVAASRASLGVVAKQHLRFSNIFQVPLKNDVERWRNARGGGSPVSAVCATLFRDRRRATVSLENSGRGLPRPRNNFSFPRRHSRLCSQFVEEFHYARRFCERRGSAPQREVSLRRGGGRRIHRRQKWRL